MGYKFRENAFREEIKSKFIEYKRTKNTAARMTNFFYDYLKLDNSIYKAFMQDRGLSINAVIEIANKLNIDLLDYIIGMPDLEQEDYKEELALRTRQLAHAISLVRQKKTIITLPSKVRT